MSALAPISPKLAKLLPMLGSDQAGEVTATAAAIGRTLKAAGLDWHDLTVALVSPPARSSTPRPAPPRPDPAPRSYPYGSDTGTRSSSGQSASAIVWCETCLARSGLFNAREVDFLQSVLRGLRRNDRLTCRQIEWLGDLFSRCARTGP